MSCADIYAEMVISEKIKKLETADINEILDKAIKEIEKFILELNQDQLYERGEVNVNNPAQREIYAASTIKQKKKRATYKKTDFVTLRWEGEFYEKFKLLIFEDYIVIDSTDLKWANWLGENSRFKNALGLTEKSRKELRKEILPIIIRKLKNEL